MSDLDSNEFQEVQLQAPKAKAKDRRVVGPQSAPTPRVLRHEHPITSYKAVGGGLAQPRTAIWFPDCQLCRKEDAERRALTTPQIPWEELHRTVFLFPGHSPEAQVCREYVRQTYPDAKLMGSQINLSLVCNKPDTQIVCVRRVARFPLPLITVNEKVLDDQTNRYNQVERPFVDLLPDVLESAPILIEDCVTTDPGSLLIASATDDRELIERISDLFYGYRVQAPNSPDTVLSVSFQ